MTTVAFVVSRLRPGVAIKGMTYRPEVDGLRAVAILPVLLFHGGLRGFENGFLGVDIFFVISGYLITNLLLHERRETGTISLAAFYERRLRRIVPALVVVMCSTAAVAWLVLTPIRMEEFAKSLIAVFTFSANFWFLAETHYFSTAADQQPLLHLWSLSVEEQFYVFLPLIMLATLKVSERKLACGVVALAAASLILAQVVSTASPDAAFYRPDTRAWELLIGSACAFVAGRNLPLGKILAAVGVILIALALFVLPRPDGPGILSVPVCLGVALVLLFASAENGIGRVLSAPGITHLGLISYSLYLWHQPLLALARIQKMAALSVEETAAILLVSVFLAALTWWLIEQPFRDRRRLNRKAIFAAAACAAGALISFGVAGRSSEGFAFRYGELVGKYFASVGTVDDQGGTRQRAIGMGVCHFRADMSPPIDQFLRNWKCVGSARGASMLVIGDSHAADKAAAFKLNGVDVAQMTGAGCSAAPSQMSPDCRRIFELVKEYSVAHPFRTLIIANKQFPTGYTSAEIDEAVAFWRPLNARILWFSDMPQFADLEDRKARNLLATGSAAQGIFPSTLKDAKANFESMRGVARGRFLAIDSARLYCFISAPEDCRPFIEGQGWAALPEGHLTAIGAYLFGRQMLADPAFNL